jgi:hypothetical protein
MTAQGGPAERECQLPVWTILGRRDVEQAMCSGAVASRQEQQPRTTLADSSCGLPPALLVIDRTSTLVCARLPPDHG